MDSWGGEEQGQNCTGSRLDGLAMGTSSLDRSGGVGVKRASVRQSPAESPGEGQGSQTEPGLPGLKVLSKSEISLTCNGTETVVSVSVALHSLLTVFA